MWLWLLSLVAVSSSQTVRQIPLPFQSPLSCSPHHFFSSFNYSCISCPTGLISTSHYSCECPPEYIAVNFTSSGPECKACPPGQKAFAGRCVICPNGSCDCPFGQVLRNGTCAKCQSGFRANQDQSECVKCNSFECVCQSGGCGSLPDLPSPSSDIWLSDGTAGKSLFIEQHLQDFGQRCQLGSQQDCQALLNMCVLQNLDRLSASCSLALKIAPQLLSLLFVDGDADSELMKESALPRSLAMGDRLSVFVAVFHRNGTFFQLLPMWKSPLLLCTENDDGLGNITMGTRVNRHCLVRTGDLRKKELFVEVLLHFTYQGVERMYPLPVVNRQLRASGQFPNKKPSESNRWQLSRRFFLADASGQNGNATSILRFASRVHFHFKLQPSRDGLIFPPFVEVDYSEAIASDGFSSVDLAFRVTFLADPEYHDRDVEITMAVLAPSSIIWAGLLTYSWGRRSGKQLLSDASAVLQFLLFSAGCLGEVFFLISSFIACWLTFTYKTQYFVFYNVLDEAQEASLRTYLFVSLILKAISAVQRIAELILQRTFFVDWERPRTITDATRRPVSQDAVKDSREFPPVAWRTYLVANEWSELFNYRKTSIALQMLSVLVLLEFFGWKNFAIVEPGFQSETPPHSAESTFLTRFGVYVAVYLAVGLSQWVIQVMVLERILIDPFHNFIDLCSVANISVLSLTHSLFGYYIHGRSVHGRGDASMAEMNEFLQRERDNLCGNRGLEAGSDLQTFFAALPASFSRRYDDIMRAEREGPRVSGFDQMTAKIATTTKTHDQMNTFLKEFVDHSLSDVDYSTRDRAFIEALLDVETTDTLQIGSLTRDSSEMAFSRCFLYGNEWTFLSFECALFCLISLSTDSLILGSLAVFLTSSAIRSLCSVLARGQLARCSLVDTRFLW